MLIQDAFLVLEKESTFLRAMLIQDAFLVLSTEELGILGSRC
jgi:hypothetical protein